MAKEKEVKGPFQITMHETNSESMIQELGITGDRDQELQKIIITEIESKKHKTYIEAFVVASAQCRSLNELAFMSFVLENERTQRQKAKNSMPENIEDLLDMLKRGDVDAKVTVVKLQGKDNKDGIPYIPKGPGTDLPN